MICEIRSSGPSTIGRRVAERKEGRSKKPERQFSNIRANDASFDISTSFVALHVGIGSLRTHFQRLHLCLLAR